MKYISQEVFPLFNLAADPAEAWGIMAGINFSVSDATSVNLAWGWSEYLDNEFFGQNTDSMTIHANVLWQPVRQMRLGWEVHWGEISRNGLADRDSAGAQFGAWFFF